MSGSSPSGFQEPRTTASDYASFEFMINSILNKAWIMTLVEVVNCTNSGGLTPEGTVDVRPLVHMRDASGNPIPHDVIYGLLYFRAFGGGKNALIMDPAKGDQGFAIFAHSDISLVKSRNGPAIPGSNRRNNPADGVYFGGSRNIAPTQFLQFMGDHLNVAANKGITLTTAGPVTIDAPDVKTTGNLHAGTGATGTFPTPTGSIVTVVDGIIVNIS